MKSLWHKVRLGELVSDLTDSRTFQVDDEDEILDPTIASATHTISIGGQSTGFEVRVRRRVKIEPGDLVFSRLHTQNGAFAFANQRFQATGTFIPLAVNEARAETRFLFWALDQFVPTLSASDTVGRETFKTEDILALEIPLPPLAEQRRVVARIEKLAAQINEARTLRRQAVEEAEALGATASSKRFRDIKTTKPLSALIADGTTISYGVLVPGPEVEDGIPFIRIQDLVEAPARPSKRISPEIEKAYGRTRLKGGEVLIAVVGATIGKVGVAPDSWRGANIARAVCRIVPSPELDRDFLVYVLRSQGAQEYFHSVTRTLAQPTLNVGQLERTRIPVPLLAEQRRIVAELDALQAEVDALKRLQAETAAELDALMPSILDKAFRGELCLVQRPQG
jgi:hypothetical protein